MLKVPESEIGSLPGSGHRTEPDHRRSSLAPREDTDHGVFAPLARQFDGGYAVAVAKVTPRTSRDEMARSALMARAAIAEDDGLNQRGPAEIVDVIQRGTGID